MVMVIFLNILLTISEVYGFLPIWLNTTTIIATTTTKPVWTVPSVEPTQKENSEEAYDFIVIGSGPTGSVIANRLSENPAWKILLLEAGTTPTVFTEIPGITGYFLLTDYNWGYLAEKQDNMGLGFVDQRIHWSRGKVLGGSSVINGMVYIRGNRLDFDRWAKNGNTGWSYKDVLPYFKKFENYRVKIQDKDYHQQDGPLTIEDVAYRSECANAFVKAMQEIGYKYLDYNGKSQIGVSYVHATTKFGRRSNAYNAFIEPILNRKNLKVLTQARVTKILINKDTKRAYGVKYVKDRQNHIALASKEVILSAGGLNSPQLLILSGIGPKNHLEELGISVIHDLPVGQKLYDHLGFYGLVIEANDSITVPYPEISNIIETLYEYKFGKGILTTLSGIEALGILKTNLSNDAWSYPDIELVFFGSSMQADKGELFRKGIGINDEMYSTIWKPLEGKNVFSIVPMQYHPKSVGYLKLKSKNPYHWPKFFANYLTDTQNIDVKTFIESIRFVQRLLQMPAFQKYNAKLINTQLPLCKQWNYDTDEYWECSLRHLSASLYHPVAACKMGPVHDSEAVVNNDLFVHGIKGLRTADNSIIPQHIAAHTNAVSFMIGEKISDMIKDYWSKA